MPLSQFLSLKCLLGYFLLLCLSTVSGFEIIFDPKPKYVSQFLLPTKKEDSRVGDFACGWCKEQCITPLIFVVCCFPLFIKKKNRVSFTSHFNPKLNYIGFYTYMIMISSPKAIRACLDIIGLYVKCKICLHIKPF